MLPSLNQIENYLKREKGATKGQLQEINEENVAENLLHCNGQKSEN
jgi:hypothetical protein